MTTFKNIFERRSPKPPHSKVSQPAHVLLGVIAWYQKARTGHIAPCRFYPSCSQYALEAIETYGALCGSALALRRLSKCRPLGPHGIDLVPLAKKDRTIPS